jgi:hypothetical protein
MNQEIKLPPLPDFHFETKQCVELYSAVQMQAYATAAIELDRAQRGEPYAWHYTNNGGASVWHMGPSNRLDADMQAAKDYPKVHRVVSLYTAAQPERQPDCRTCRRFISGGDGCTTVVTCTSGDQYKPTTPIYFWEKP